MLKIIIISLILFIGCEQSENKEKPENDRFMWTYMQFDNKERIGILVDKKTNVKYLYVKTYKSAGLTVLIDK